MFGGQKRQTYIHTSSALTVLGYLCLVIQILENPRHILSIVNALFQVDILPNGLVSSLCESALRALDKALGGVGHNTFNPLLSFLVGLT